MRESGKSSAPPDLRAQWLRRLAFEWLQVNFRKLHGALRSPSFELLRTERVAGKWMPVTRTIGISEQLIWTARWEDVLETLHHEIAHQYAHEVLQAYDEEPHGPAFVEACRRLGVSHSATGTVAPEGDRRLDKIRKLLALAESSNPHEAEAAMAAANTLLLRYNLDVASLGGDQRYVQRRIGASFKAVQLEAKLVASILSSYFFVKCIWVPTWNARTGRDETTLEILGTLQNVEMAHYVHDFLHGEVERWWQSERLRLRKGATRTARREFGYGVLCAFSSKLQSERASNAETGLIWLGDPKLSDFYDSRYPARRKMARGQGVRLSEAHAAGTAVGNSITIRRGVHESDTASQKALPAGK